MKAEAFGGRLRLVVYGWGDLCIGADWQDRIGTFINNTLKVITLV